MSSALLILDMINLFDFEGGPALASQAVKIVPKIDALRKAYADQGLAIVYANDNFMDWNQDFKALVERASLPNGPGSYIANALRPTADQYYVLKPKHSAFLCTALPVILSDLKIDELVITGIAADSCVLMTAQDAHMRDYKVRVPSDCVAAISLARTKRALALLADSMHLEPTTSAKLVRSRTGPDSR